MGDWSVNGSGNAELDPAWEDGIVSVTVSDRETGEILETLTEGLAFEAVGCTPEEVEKMFSVDRKYVDNR